MRKAIFEFANSGALSEESKAELLYELEHSRDIFDVGATYMEHGGFLGWLDKTTNTAQKDLETIGTIASFLEEDEQKVLNFASGATSTGGTMLLTLSGAALTPVIGPAAAGWAGALMGAVPSWADTKEYYRIQKGASKGSASFWATMQFLGEAAVNHGGSASFVDDLFDPKGFYGGLQRQMAKNPGTFMQNLKTAAKYSAKHIAQAGAEEGFEGLAELGMEKGVELSFDLVNAEIEAIQRGEGVSVFRPLINLTEQITQTDPVEIGKEMFNAFSSEAVMGMIFRAVGDVAMTPVAFKRAGQARKYVNIGDTKHEIAFSLPATAGLSIGAGIAKKMGAGEGVENIAMGILADQFNQIFDNTYLSSINDIFRGYEDGTGVMTRLLNTTAESYMQQMFSPAALRAVAKMQDPYARDTGSESSLRQMINETVIQNWPGIRQTLPVKYDVTGDPMTQHKAYQKGGVWESTVMNFVDSMLSPTSTYSDKNDDQLIELLDISYRTGETAFLPPASFATKNKLYVTKTIAKKMKVADSGFNVHLDDAQMRKVNQMYSDILFNGTGELKIQKPGGVGNYKVDGLCDVMDSREWKKMSDGERIERIDELKKTVKELMTAYVVRNYH